MGWDFHQEDSVILTISTNSEADAESDVFEADEESSFTSLLERVVHPGSKPFVPSGPLAMRDWAMI
jgi:hypothetical protein